MAGMHARAEAAPALEEGAQQQQQPEQAAELAEPTHAAVPEEAEDPAKQLEHRKRERQRRNQCVPALLSLTAPQCRTLINIAVSSITQVLRMSQWSCGREVLKLLTEEQLDRYEAFRRSSLSKANMRRVRLSACIICRAALVNTHGGW